MEITTPAPLHPDAAAHDPLEAAPAAEPSAAEPSRDCPRCPRLVDLREKLRVEHPTWWNAPVPVLADPDPWLAIIGLAPGLQGANRTARPFTGDRSGPLFWDTLIAAGLAEGSYSGRVEDAPVPRGIAIINAVRCLPPENKPSPEEIRTCRPFLDADLAAMPSLRVVVALGAIAHQSAVKVLGGRLPKAPFAHLAEHAMPGGRTLIDSYHCSRYNQNTGRLTPEMFAAVFARAIELREAR
ncbi:uracil-DNA glycosylase [Sphingomonas sp. Leaf62]|uniref:uracil-DNA glycosylase n=1 Tax=Sphingomonas sp. Leaf62 TaxID=1736228 RepID=UPI0009E9A865|nr:uracil-DNA glycosylase [Sphingomonas sp. Leaf62]